MPPETKTARQTFAHPRTLEFFEAAHQEGVYYQRPENPNLLATWRRNRKIMNVFFFTSASSSEIGNLYPSKQRRPLSRERVRQLKTAAIKSIWDLGSPELQAKFPFITIPLDKPLTQRSRKRISSSQGGLSVKIATGVRIGMQYSEIKDHYSLTPTQLRTTRPVLRNWNIEPPYLNTPPSENKALAANLETPSNDQLLQERYNEVSRHCYARWSKGEEPILKPLRRLLAESGINIKADFTGLLTSLLLTHGIPIGKIPASVKSGPQAGERYIHFIASHEAERVQQVAREILSDPNWREKAKALP